MKIGGVFEDEPTEQEGRHKGLNGATAEETEEAAARFTWGDYTAISYTWGSPEERETIIINKVPVTVGRNLAAALDRLRSTYVYKIWVDAIRINQDDVDERIAQVMRIRYIFSQSFAVTIWLREDEMSSTGLNS